MLEDFKNSQLVPYKILSNAINKNKISHAYLFEANDYPRTFDMAVAFAKALFCVDYDEKNDANIISNIIKQIDTNNFEEFKVINHENLVIKKEQLEQLQQEFTKKAIFNSKKIYIINGAEYLNASASNSLLKFIEEPEDNIIAILITNNIYSLLGTIVSRCQVVPFAKINETELQIYKEFDQQLVKIAINMYNNKEELEEFLNNDNNNITAIIEFIKYYEKNHQNTLLFTKKLWHNFFTDKKTITYALNIMILFYKDVLNSLLNRNIEVFINEGNLIKDIMQNNSVNKIIYKLSVLIDIKSKIGLNMNSSLLIDKLLLDFIGGEEIE